MAKLDLPIKPLDAFASFRSNDCPGCGGYKAKRTSFCSLCFRLLPDKNKAHIAAPQSRSYTNALNAAVTVLRAKREGSE